MLRKKFLAFSFLLFTLVASSYASTSSFVITADGVIVYPDAAYALHTQAVKIQVIADNIIHVTASPEKSITGFVSLSVIPATNRPAWKTSSTKEKVTIKTKLLTVEVVLQTGTVTFFDQHGKKILGEKGIGGRRLRPVTFEGQRSWNITQVFETSEAEALYGLGQHQDGLFNYNGQQVTLFQNNTEVAVPFLLSNKNYGILWDNYSITTIGDIRPYHQLSAFKLYSKNGDQGWLTATYYKDREGKIPQLTRAETSIDIPYLNDYKHILPAEFTPSKGSVTWEGSIESGFNGTHNIRMTYGGYIKIWIDGKLVLNKWRRSWNPAPAVIGIPMEAGKKYPVRIEWIPEATEVYLTFKWIEPLPATDKNDFAFSSEAGKQLNYYFVFGNDMDEVIGGYRTITGKASLVPRWALGFWQSRERYKTQEEVISTVKEFRKRKIPLDNIVLDWNYWKENDWGSQDFDPARFPNPDSMISILHNQYNTRFMISVWPKIYEGIDVYKKFDANGWLYKRNIADRMRDWIGDGYTSTFYDAFNADARNAFWELIHKKLYVKGVDAWWMDASEPDIHSNVSPEKRKEQMIAPSSSIISAEYLNAYPLQNAKGIYEGQRASDPDKRVFILTRSGYAGSQRYGATIWSGDIGARWDDMKNQIAAGLNFSMSGLPYWSMDIGGFMVEDRYQRERMTEKDQEEWREMLTRWYQFGAFTPVFRAHGQFPYREIWHIAPDDHPAYKSILYYQKLRYRLLPYIYSIAGKTYHDDYTIMRGLPMDFATDSTVLGIGDQYMFGPSLLINPVYTYQQTKRELYLPNTNGWYDLYTGKHYKGGQQLKAEAPYGQIPVFVKAGSILPFGPDLQYTDEKPADTVTLFVYTGQDARFTLYEDENTNYNYEKGIFSNIDINWNEAAKSLTIGTRKGQFKGMREKRTFKVIVISPDHPAGIEQPKITAKEIFYTGSSVTIKPT
jgi:alpha-D-xyloside xylohydrolase